MVSARQVVGKRIIAFRPGTTVVEGKVMHEPAIDLDDGSTLVFMAEEHPQGDYYGVWIGRAIRQSHPRPKGKE